MISSSDASPRNVDPSPENRQSATATLTEDLVRAVARLETDWIGRGVITQGTAREVHELRERAERLFSSWS